MATRRRSVDRKRRNAKRERVYEVLSSASPFGKMEWSVAERIESRGIYLYARIGTFPEKKHAASFLALLNLQQKTRRG